MQLVHPFRGPAAHRDPDKRPAVTGLVLFVFALKIVVDVWKRRRSGPPGAGAA